VNCLHAPVSLHAAKINKKGTGIIDKNVVNQDSKHFQTRISDPDLNRVKCLKWNHFFKNEIVRFFNAANKTCVNNTNSNDLGYILIVENYKIRTTIYNGLKQYKNLRISGIAHLKLFLFI
jgi:hypothetical protein